VRRSLVVLALLCLVSACTTQSKFRSLGPSYPPKAADAVVEVFEDQAPTRSHARIARLDAHFEKTTFVSTSRQRGIEELKKQARLAGADGIVDIREQRSHVGETQILHMTATAIRYTSP
jgi:hypothetical protein